eukprot:TRINITY_DN11651_c0_g1_i1.p1 TRINITY_DN11651_c0_g1~~TRINITY_DN11651_c0_g1_i1.p1  ORF type:complete len:443 (-),score=66.05 TRINITY_DN11651_c0_g1_i1:286-1614(-)
MPNLAQKANEWQHRVLRSDGLDEDETGLHSDDDDPTAKDFAKRVAGAGFTKELLAKHAHTHDVMELGAKWGLAKGDPARGINPLPASKISELFLAPEKKQLWKKIKPHAVEQGMLGNCWFLAALAALAEFPAKIRQLFDNLAEQTESGVYQVSLFHPGRQRFVKVCVDDKMPGFEAEGGTPVIAAAGGYMASNGKVEIWGQVVEKAFAKFCGSYSNTEYGFTCWGLVYLCGGQGVQYRRYNMQDGSIRWAVWKCEWVGGEQEDGHVHRKFWGSHSQELMPSEIFVGSDGKPIEPQLPGNDLYSCDVLWGFLADHVARGFPMACEILVPKQDMKGLLAAHAYTIISVKEVVVTEKLPCVRLVKLRNPHGSIGAEWTGEWGDDSVLWDMHKNVAKQLRFKPGADGTFWLPYEAFVFYFDGVDLVKMSLPLQGCHPDKLRAIRGF